MINAVNWSRKSLKKPCKVQTILCLYGVVEVCTCFITKSFNGDFLQEVIVLMLAYFAEKAESSFRPIFNRIVCK